MRLRIAWATDPGLEREENEDSVSVWRNQAGTDTFLVVCDGMGGHAAGQTASSMAVKTVTKVLAEDGQDGPDIERLKRACKEANSAVFEAARDNPDWTGMGSTMVIAAIKAGELALLNVGDSPAYLFRNALAKLVSQDHSGPAREGRARRGARAPPTSFATVSRSWCRKTIRGRRSRCGSGSSNRRRSPRAR